MSTIESILIRTCKELIANRGNPPDIGFRNTNDERSDCLAFFADRNASEITTQEIVKNFDAITFLWEDSRQYYLPCWFLAALESPNEHVVDWAANSIYTLLLWGLVDVPDNELLLYYAFLNWHLRETEERVSNESLILFEAEQSDES